ncbi:MAG TPA: hypothetical protein VJP59_08495 [Gemmatimonadota bacterium]|nr:hypothetical protein [Gemmatimonadota bacterium]
MPRIAPWTFGLLGLVPPACNDLPTVFDPLPAVRVEITAGNCGAASPRVIVGSDCELEAMAFDDNGQAVRAGFGWSTGDPSIATVAPKPGFDTTVAEITGVAAGRTTIRVRLSADPDVFTTRELSVITPPK